MKLIFQGAEVPSNRELLSSMGVQRVGVSFKGLTERVKRDVEELLINFPDDLEIHAYPGGSRANLTVAEHKELAERYETFVSANRGRLSSWVEYDAAALGPEWISQRRREFYDAFDDMCFRPMWHHDSGASVLEGLSERYPHVVLASKSLEAVPGLQGTLSTLQRKYETSFHVMNAPSLVDLQGQGRFEYEGVYTMSWTSPMRHGDTIVWEKNRLVRYPKKMQDEARSQHRSLITEIGLDPDEIIQDGKPSEVSKLAIWSLLQFEQYDGARPSLTLISTISDRQEGGDLVDGGHNGADINVPEDRQIKPTSGRRARHPSERTVLPSVAVDVTTSVVEEPDGTKTVQELPVIRSTSSSTRNCDTCFVAANCPSFKAHSDCAFSLPSSIKTRDQLLALLQAVIETQSNRVFFGKFAEDVNGGYPDPTVGKEMDRLMNQVKLLKELENNNEFVRLTVERQTSSGILSQIFGDKAGQMSIPPQISDN